MNEIANKKENKKAVIYCRVSTKEQVEEGNSLVSQEKTCKEYAFKNGYEIAHVFIDGGESAKTQERKELKNLLAYCADKKNKISAVVAYKIDRISRNMDDYSQIRIILKTHGVEIKSTSEHFENTPAGKFMENIIANVAQFDNDVRAERCIGGMREATKEGRYVWMAPVGYNNVRIGGKATIAPDIKMGPLIKRTFELITQTIQPIEVIRKQMVDEGLRNKGGKPLSKSYFYALLRNELYTGWIIKFGERIRGTFDAIISEETFAQVQRILKYKGHKHSQHITDNPDFPLRRFVVNEHGKKLTGSWSKGRSKRYPYYRFGLKGSNYKKDELEKAFICFMNSFALNERLFQSLKKYVKEHLVKAHANESKESDRLKKYVNDLTEKQTKVIEQNHQGIISNATLKVQLAIIEDELFRTHSALAQSSIEEIDYGGILETSKEYLKNPGKTWVDAPIDAKLLLQWFQFPSGCTLKGIFFGTGEVASFFKVKDAIASSNSFIVDSGLKKWNHTEVPSHEQYSNEVSFISQLRKNIVRLSEILEKESKA